MTITRIFDDLIAMGLEITACNGKLRFRPQSKMSADMIERLTMHKADILAILNDNRGYGSCEECKLSLIGIPTHDGFLNQLCTNCGRWHRCVAMIEANESYSTHDEWDKNSSQ